MAEKRFTLKIFRHDKFGLIDGSIDYNDVFSAMPSLFPDFAGNDHLPWFEHYGATAYMLMALAERYGYVSIPDGKEVSVNLPLDVVETMLMIEYGGSLLTFPFVEELLQERDLKKLTEAFIIRSKLLEER